MTKDEAAVIVDHLRKGLTQIEFALVATNNLSDQEQASSLEETLKSASADIIGDALLPIFQLYPDLQPDSLIAD